MNYSHDKKMKEKRVMDNNCETALNDFPFHDDPSTWIEEHGALYNRISIESIPMSINAKEPLIEQPLSFTIQFYNKFNKLLAEL